MHDLYLKYFGLKEPAFNITPDPSFLYLSASHREGLAQLSYGINARKGFIVKPYLYKQTVPLELRLYSVSSQRLWIFCVSSAKNSASSTLKARLKACMITSC
jgi:hypothetical protein